MREYVTINCGTSDGEVTKVGSDCLLMAYCHVAHGCLLEDRVIVSNSTSFAGDVHIGKCATVSGLIGVHQFCRIGAYSMVGPVIAVLQDVPPFMMVAGNPVGIKGTNKVGLTRRGFSDEVRNILRSAYKILCRSGLNVTDAITKINEDLPETPEILELIEFYKSSKRGVIK
jgi:UDP-N-acetylglucosamine acyltransferase